MYPTGIQPNSRYSEGLGVDVGVSSKRLIKILSNDSNTSISSFLMLTQVSELTKIELRKIDSRKINPVSK